VSAESTNYREAKYLVGRAHHFTYGDGGDPVAGGALATEALVHAVLALVDTLAQPQLEEKATAAAATATPELTAYRAEHPDSGITLGHYGASSAARAHCEAMERRSWPVGTTLAFDWIEDDEDRVAELVVTAGQNEESTTGYIVTALELASEYDEESDE
jgi:hypothetical protein